MNSTLRKVEESEIGRMLKFVYLDTGIPGHKYKELAVAITQQFEVECTESDIANYERLHIMMEDYELEGRRHAYRFGELF